MQFVTVPWSWWDWWANFSPLFAVIAFVAMTGWALREGRKAQDQARQVQEHAVRVEARAARDAFLSRNPIVMPAVAGRVVAWRQTLDESFKVEATVFLGNGTPYPAADIHGRATIGLHGEVDLEPVPGSSEIHWLDANAYPGDRGELKFRMEPDDFDLVVSGVRPLELDIVWSGPPGRSLRRTVLFAGSDNQATLADNVYSRECRILMSDAGEVEIQGLDFD